MYAWPNNAIAILERIERDAGIEWDMVDRETLLAAFIELHCDPNAFIEYLVEAIKSAQPRSGQRNADRIDGYDRDDLGESPDF